MFIVSSPNNFYTSTLFEHLVSVPGCSQKNEEKVLYLGGMFKSTRSEGMPVKLMLSLEPDWKVAMECFKCIIADSSLLPFTAVAPQIKSS